MYLVKCDHPGIIFFACPYKCFLVKRALAKFTLIKDRMVLHIYKSYRRLGQQLLLF